MKRLITLFGFAIILSGCSTPPVSLDLACSNMATADVSLLCAHVLGK